MIRRRHRQVDQQPRIVKLPVVVDNPAAQFFRLQRRKPLQRLLLDKQLRRRQTHTCPPAGHRASDPIP